MMEFKQIALDEAEIKLSGDGSIVGFTGYASVFGGVDSHGDTIHKGAYKAVIGTGAEVKMYYNHGWLRNELPIGKMVVVEDDKGLFVKNAEFTKGIKLADDVALAVMHKTVDGLSIGYRVGEYKQKPEGGRDIFSFDVLKEVSVVDNPSDRNALISGVDIKSAIESATKMKEIESLLRDAAGFSRSDAVALVSRIKAMVQSESETKQSPAEIAATIQQFDINAIFRSN